MNDAAPPSVPPPPARADSGQALFRALAGTIALLRWLLLGLVALYLGSGITRVAPHEDALVYRFGRLQRTLHPPGLCFALPAPIDRVVKIPTRTQHELFLNHWAPEETAATAPAAAMPAAPTTQIPASLLAVLPAANTGALSAGAPPPGAKGLHPVFDGYTLTGDTNLVQARLTLRYRIADPFAYASAAAPETVPGLLDAAVFAAATQILAATRIDDALTVGLESLRARVRDLAQRRLDTLGLGIELVAFEINALTPPLATAAAFADVTSAQVEARTTLETARTYRAQAAPRATADAFRLRRQAEADGREFTTRARGEAAAFLALLAEHRRAPALLETRLRAETLEQILPRVKTKTVVPADAASLNLYLREK